MLGRYRGRKLPGPGWPPRRCLTGWTGRPTPRPVRRPALPFGPTWRWSARILRVPCQKSHTGSDLVFCVITRLLSRTRYQQPQPPETRFRYHVEEGREQGPVRPVQLRATRLPPLQDGDLVAQGQDLRSFPRLLTPGQPQPRGNPRDQQEHEPPGT
jgi:hypothetical protein